MITGVVGLVGSGLLLTVSANDVEVWVTVLCACVIAIFTCGLEVYNMITKAKDEKVEREKEEKLEEEAEKAFEEESKEETNDGKE